AEVVHQLDGDRTGEPLLGRSPERFGGEKAERGSHAFAAGVGRCPVLVLPSHYITCGVSEWGLFVGKRGFEPRFNQRKVLCEKGWRRQRSSHSGPQAGARAPGASVARRAASASRAREAMPSASR